MQVEDIKPSGAYYVDSEQHVEMKPKKEPKRVLYFSDGTLEEFSSDSEDEMPVKENPEKQIEVSKLSWGSWTMHHVVNMSRVLLHWSDAVGEKMAYAFGITSPKYYYVIQEKLDAMNRGKSGEYDDDPNMAGDLDDGNTYFTEMPTEMDQNGNPIDLDKATDEIQRKLEV